MLVPFDPNNIHYLEQQASEALKVNDMNKYQQIMNKIKILIKTQQNPLSPIQLEKSNIHLLEKEASEALKHNDINKYNQLLNKIKLMSRQNPLPTIQEEFEIPQLTTIESNQSDANVQTEEEDEILRLPIIDLNSDDNAMDMSIIPLDSETIIKDQQKRINELENKLYNYRALVRKPKANAKVQTDFDVPSKKRKHDGYESEDTSKGMKKYENLLLNANNKTLTTTNIAPYNIKRQKYLQLLQEHTKVPKSRYSFLTEKRSEIREEDLSEDEEGSVSYLALSNKDTNSRKGPQWKQYK